MIRSAPCRGLISKCVNYFQVVNIPGRERTNRRRDAMRISTTLLFMLAIVLAAGAAAKVKIACIGNSITYGYGLSSPTTQSYPGRLQIMLGTGNYTVENDGVNATTLLRKGDNPYYKNGKLPQVFAFQPDIITIKLGTNDTKPQNWDAHRQEFKGDYLWMIDTLLTMASKPKIWLVLPVPVFNNPTAVSWGIRDSIVKKIISIIKEVSAERGLPVIDVNTPLLSFPQYFKVDGVHPDAAGEDTIARIVYRTLLAATATVPEPAAFQGVPLRHKETWAGIGFPRSVAAAPPMRLFDLSGRRLYADRRSQGAGLPEYKWYILNDFYSD
jgi:lysophospholipase L1-like esterase